MEDLDGDVTFQSPSSARYIYAFTTVSGIIRCSGTSSLMAPRPAVWVRFAADLGWAGCSTTTSARHDGLFGWPLEH